MRAQRLRRKVFGQSGEYVLKRDTVHVRGQNVGALASPGHAIDDYLYRCLKVVPCDDAAAERGL